MRSLDWFHITGWPLPSLAQAARAFTGNPMQPIINNAQQAIHLNVLFRLLAILHIYQQCGEFGSRAGNMRHSKSFVGWWLALLRVAIWCLWLRESFFVLLSRFFTPCRKVIIQWLFRRYMFQKGSSASVDPLFQSWVIGDDSRMSRNWALPTDVLAAHYSLVPH